MQDQQEAEKKKQISEEIQAHLHKQLGEIDKKSADVKAELAGVEPAVIDAQNGKYKKVSHGITVARWVSETLCFRRYVCMASSFYVRVVVLSSRENHQEAAFS